MMQTTEELQIEMAKRLYRIQPVTVTRILLLGGHPHVLRKEWEECSDEEQAPWMKLADDILGMVARHMAPQVASLFQPQTM